MATCILPSFYKYRTYVLAKPDQIGLTLIEMVLMIHVIIAQETTILIRKIRIMMKLEIDVMRMMTMITGVS